MITEREPSASNLSRYEGSQQQQHYPRHALRESSSPSPLEMKRESRSSLIMDEDSNGSTASTNLAIDVHSCHSGNTTPTPSMGWSTEDLLHHGGSGSSAELAAQLKRKDVFNARKQREFIPDNKKDETYWDRRRRNNEAAKRSREKRRLNDMVLETRVIELTKENTFLRTQLVAIRDQFGIIGETLVTPVSGGGGGGGVSGDHAPYPSNEQVQQHHHQVALNLSKRAKLLTTPSMLPVHSPQAMMANPAPPVAALRSLVMASALQQQQKQHAKGNSNGRHPLSNGNGKSASNGNRMVDANSYGEYWNEAAVTKYRSASFSHPPPPHHPQQHHPMTSQPTSPYMLPNGHHHHHSMEQHQGALLSALNGSSNNNNNNNGSENNNNGYERSRYAGSYSPPYNNNSQTVINNSVDYSSARNPIAQHQRHAYSQNGNGGGNGNSASSYNNNRSNQSSRGHSVERHYDDCCSNCSSSGDEGNAGYANYHNHHHNNNNISNGSSGRNSVVTSPTSPYESVVVDVEHYSSTATPNGRASTPPVTNNSDASDAQQLHLPHKLRHKPRLSECSAPALSPPALPLASPTITPQRSSSSPPPLPPPPTSGDERDTHSPEVRVNRRKRKASVFCAASVETAVTSPVAGVPLETENTQLKMEMQRLAIEVASLKDILFCKGGKEGSEKTEGNGSTKSDGASSRDSGFVTEVDKDEDEELSCG